MYNIIQNISRSGTILAPEIEPEPEKTENNNGRSNCPIILETYSTDVMEEEAIADEVLELEELGFLDDASRPCDEQTGAPTVGHAVALTEYHTCLRCGKVCSR